jgi:outer membrane protein assembly factor BamB
MKINNKILIILIIIFIPLILGACSGGRRIAATGWSGITARDEVVYFSYGPHAYAVNLNNGTQKWQFPAERINGVDFYAAPVFADEGTQLIIAGYNNILYSVDPATGSENWVYDGATNRYISAPLVTEEGIFASSADNNLYAVDFEGFPIWIFETEGPIWASPALSETCGCIYLASMDHHLYAIESDSGNLIWKSDDLGGPIVSQPAVSETGLVIVSTFNDEVVALDEENQQVVWRFITSDWAWASPVVDEGQVYVSDISGAFYALDLVSGELIWQLTPGGSIVSAPLVVEDLIYFSTDTSSLIVVSRDGIVQRNLSIDGKLYASPATAGDKILLAPSESEFFLIALNQNGIQTWGYPPTN